MVVKGASWIIGPQKKPNWKDIVSPPKKPLGMHNTACELQDNSRRVSQRIERQVAESPPSSPMPLSFSRQETGLDSEDELCRPRLSPSSSPSSPPPAKGVLRFRVPNTVSPSKTTAAPQPRQADPTKPRHISTTVCQNGSTPNTNTRPRFSVSTSTTPRSSMYSTITPSKTPSPATPHQPLSKAPVPRPKSLSIASRTKTSDTKSSSSDSRSLATPPQAHTRTTTSTKSYPRPTLTKPSVTKPSSKREGSPTKTTTPQEASKSPVKATPAKAISKQDVQHRMNEKEQRASTTLKNDVSINTINSNNQMSSNPVQPLLPPLAVEQCASSTRYPGAIRTPVESTTRHYAPQLTPPSSPPPSNITLDLDAKDTTLTEEEEEDLSSKIITSKAKYDEDAGSSSSVIPETSLPTLDPSSPPSGLAGQEPSPSSTPLDAPHPRRLFASDTPLPRYPLVKISKDPSVLFAVMLDIQQRMQHLGQEFGKSTLCADKGEDDPRKLVSLKDKQAFLKLQEQRRKSNLVNLNNRTTVEKSCGAPSLSGYQLKIQSPSSTPLPLQVPGPFIVQNSSTPNGSFPVTEFQSCQCKAVAGRATSPSTREGGHLLCKTEAAVVAELAITTPTSATSNMPFPSIADSQFSPSIAIPQLPRPSGYEETNTTSLPDFFAQTPSQNRLDRRYYPGYNQGAPFLRSRCSSALSTRMSVESSDSLLYPQDPYALYYPWAQRGSGAPSYLSLPQHFQDKQGYHPWQQRYPDYPYSRDHYQDYHQRHPSFPDTPDIPPPPPLADPHMSEAPPHLYPQELNSLMGPMHPYYGRYRDDYRPQQVPYPGEGESGRRGQWPMTGPPSMPAGADLNNKPDPESKPGSRRPSAPPPREEQPELEAVQQPQLTTTTTTTTTTTREYDWRDGFLSPCSDYFGSNPQTTPPIRPVRSASDAQVTSTTTAHTDPPPANDLDILSKRLANVGLMDAMCPAVLLVTHTDERWATQVHSLLSHLANKVDTEMESQSFVRRKTLHRSNSMVNVGQGGLSGGGGGGVELATGGVYEHVLRDWVQRLQQVPLEVIRQHPGLKRELDKIRWQYGSLAYGKTVVLTTLTIKIIPAKQVSDDILCSSSTCHIGLEETDTVSTTQSSELEFSARGHFSETVKSSTALNYQLDLVQGDAGYIGMVDVHVLADVEHSGCQCHGSDILIVMCKMSIQHCHAFGTSFMEMAYHDAVVWRDRRPRSIVSFVYIN
ncbi:hypothetical protein CPB97_002829 [Podila verticillata]|nr:hypothetical protein CPB97_002829 [Podila verticillata]